MDLAVRSGWTGGAAGVAYAAVGTCTCAGGVWPAHRRMFCACAVTVGDGVGVCRQLRVGCWILRIERGRQTARAAEGNKGGAWRYCRLSGGVRD